MSRFLTVVLIAVVAALSATRSASAQGWVQSEFVIGSWEDPLSADTVTTRATYQQAKDAYFNLLTGTVFHTHYAGTRTSCLTMAGEIGLHAFVTDGRFTMACCGYTSPTFDPSIPPTVLPEYDTSGADALTALQNDALWGYTMWDEPAWNTTNYEYFKGWVGAFHADDAARNDGHHRAVYLNLFSGCGSPTCGYYSLISSFVSDPDPARCADVVSADIYPFSGPTQNPSYTSNYFFAMRNLRDAMGTRPFWIVSLSYPGYGASIPDDNQLRFMTFAPAAAGAKGILWFLYRNPDTIDYYDAVVNNDRVPTCVYSNLKTINHYVHDVVGPIVMSNTYVGTFHQSSQPTYDPFRPDTDFVSSAYAATRCPASDLGNADLMTGVWQGLAQPNDLYMLIVNKALTTRNATVTLRSSYTVTASPSVVGYAGGTSYVPVTTGTSFAVSLAGGEGRMYRLTPSATQDFALTSALDGQTWTAGMQRQITWQPSNAPVTATVYAAPAENAPEISGPSATLGSGLTGGSATLTMPSLQSNRARLVLSATGSDNVLRRVSHQQPFRTASAPGQTVSHWSLGSGHCYMDADLAIGQDGTEHLVMRDNYGKITYRTFDGSAWSDPTTMPGPVTYVSPSITVDYAGLAHMVYFDLFQQKLMHAFQWSAGEPWNVYVVANVGNYSGNTAMTRGPNDYMYFAFNTGSLGGFRLKVYRSYYGQIWQPYAYAVESSNPRSIGIAADANDPWVAYIDGMGGQTALHVVKNAGSGAVSSLALTGAYGQVSIAMDASGNPLIAYSRVGADGSSTLYYRASSGGVWGNEVAVDASVASIDGISLALRGGAPRIAYAANGVAKYAMLAGGTWILDTLDGADDVSGPIKLAFAPNGNGWVSSFDRTLDNLRVSSFTPDVTPPSAIGLAESGGCYDHIYLSWLAPGDDGTTGTAAAYDLRWSSSTITEANFASATPIATGAPQPAWSEEQLTVMVPRCSAARYYAIKARDEVYNWSALSNIGQVAPGCPRPPIQCEEGTRPLPDEEEDLPAVLEFAKPAPNPTTDAVVEFKFGVPRDLAGAEYELSIFDVNGRRLAQVERGQATAGYHTITWSPGRDGSSRRGGLYFARLQVGTTRLTRSIVVTR